MKILVPVKRVIDYNVKIRIKADGSGVETQNVKMSMNPFDEIAVEEAVRLKEKSIATDVIALSIGPAQSVETLRTALAMGATRAIHVLSNDETQSLDVAKIIKHFVVQENINLVIMGKQAIDDDCNQTGQMLGAILDWPQGSFASKLEIKDNHAIVTREIDGGLQTLDLTLPAVITTDLRLNEPRYATLPNIMKAKKIVIESVEIASINIALAPRIKTLAVSAPPVRKGGIKVADVASLIDKLKNEAKVIGN